MTARSFIDSNVLVYAYDSQDALKQSVASMLIADCIQDESGALSAQVLGEFFIVVTRKIPDPLSTAEASVAVDLISNLHVAVLDRMTVRRAIANHQRFKISYWDSLIVAAAEESGCSQIYSEDLNAGQSYNGIEVSNPFRRN